MGKEYLFELSKLIREKKTCTDEEFWYHLCKFYYTQHQTQAKTFISKRYIYKNDYTILAFLFASRLGKENSPLAHGSMFNLLNQRFLISQEKGEQSQFFLMLNTFLSVFPACHSYLNKNILKLLSFRPYLPFREMDEPHLVSQACEYLRILRYSNEESRILASRRFVSFYNNVNDENKKLLLGYLIETLNPGEWKSMKTIALTLAAVDSDLELGQQEVIMRFLKTKLKEYAWREYDVHWRQRKSIITIMEILYSKLDQYQSQIQKIFIEKLSDPNWRLTMAAGRVLAKIDCSFDTEQQLLITQALRLKMLSSCRESCKAAIYIYPLLGVKLNKQRGLVIHILTEMLLEGGQSIRKLCIKACSKFEKSFSAKESFLGETHYKRLSSSQKNRLIDVSITQLSTEEDPSVILGAAEVLASADLPLVLDNQQKIFKCLNELVENKNWRIRQAALSVLPIVFPKLELTFNERLLLSWKISGCLYDEIWYVVKAATLTLSSLDLRFNTEQQNMAVDALGLYLEDANFRHQITAVNGLAVISNKIDFPVKKRLLTLLIKQLELQESLIKNVAIEALKSCAKKLTLENNEKCCLIVFEGLFTALKAQNTESFSLQVIEIINVFISSLKEDMKNYFLYGYFINKLYTEDAAFRPMITKLLIVLCNERSLQYTQVNTIAELTLLPEETSEIVRQYTYGSCSNA